MTEIATPFLKWAGGKRQILPQLLELVPKKFRAYHEPFLGGGALFFALQQRDDFSHSFLSDSNQRLIRSYRGVRQDCRGVIRRLRRTEYTREFYEWMRERPVDRYSDAYVAAWMIYLNRTGFNGLYRVNSQNRFNVPFGKYTDPQICRADNLRACSRALGTAGLIAGDFRAVLNRAQRGDFVYFDPPYAPLSATSSFASYTQDGFGTEDHVRLRDIALELRKRKVSVLISNSSAPLVRDLYQKFQIREVRAARNVNSKGDGRGKIVDLLIF